MGRVCFVTRAGNAVRDLGLEPVRRTGVSYTGGLFGRVSADGIGCRSISDCRDLLAVVGGLWIL